VPAIGSPVSRHARSPDRWERDGQTMIDDRIMRYRTGAVSYVKVVAPPGEPCIIPGKSAYDFFTGSQASAPGWRNGLTRESLEKMREFDNVTSISLISPTPLAVIAAEADELIPMETLRNVYDRAGEPKEFHTLPITHFEIYREPWLSEAASLATDFFSRCL
jgi:uncharacterized protein